MTVYFDEDHFPEMLDVALKGPHLEEFCRAALTFIHTEASFINAEDLEAESEVQERVTMVQNLIGRIRGAGKVGLDIRDFIHIGRVAEKLQADTSEGLAQRMVENGPAEFEVNDESMASYERHRQDWRDETFLQLLGLFSECLAVQQGQPEKCRALHRESAAQWLPLVEQLAPSLPTEDERTLSALNMVRDLMAEEALVNNLRQRGSAIASLRSEQLERQTKILPAMIGAICGIDAGTHAGRQKCDGIIQKCRDYLQADLTPKF